jgi:hypothetical protein
MKPSIQVKPATSPVLIALALVCFGLLPGAQAVVPPPDGGYAGFNTAEGTDALFSNTTGTRNTGVGFQALYHNNGDYNTAAGLRALFGNTTGNFNTAIGAGALFTNTGDQNTATGSGALLRNTTGRLNTANGEAALFFNTTGDQNTATGASALQSNTTGDFNTANGVSALRSNTTGVANTAVGWFSLFDNATGRQNTAIGFEALASNTTGRDNTVLGFNTGSSVITASNVICIGAHVAGANVNDSCYIGSIFGRTSSGGSAVFINASGKLGTSTSSQRFKEDIKPMAQASEVLYALRPVSFHYKKEIDPVATSQFGLVAEEVEEVNRDLVVRDKEGKPYSVRYDQVNAMLLNEFLKEHRKVQELEANAAQQQRQIEALTAGLQKVSAQLELGKPAPQTVLNNQ